MGSNSSFTFSSELMMNYKNVETLDQMKKFLAVKTFQGQALFFGVSTDNALVLIKETIGSKTGWEKIELSSSLSGTVKTFDVSQHHEGGQIDIVLAMTDGCGSDSLYLSLGHSSQDLNWAKNMQWYHICDDRKTDKNTTLKVENIFITENSSSKQSIIVDTKDQFDFISRYWIDAGNVQKWNSHPLPANLASGGIVSSYLGRIAEEIVDGVYTLGSLNQTIELIYTPIFNPFNPDIAPSPINFDLSATSLNPSNSAFSGCPAASGKTNCSDIYLAGGGNLYYVSAENNENGAKPIKLFFNDLFTKVSELHAITSKNKVVIWGLNSGNQVFYTSCPLDQINNVNAWSHPLPIIDHASKISSYIMHEDNEIVLFANTGDGKLVKCTQDPVTTIWKFASIELPSPKGKAASALSYTTTVHVKDQNNKPITNTEVIVKANSHTNVFINNLYYSIGAESIKVKTDTNGTLTIIEWVDDIQATQFSFTVDSTTTSSINPTENSFNKIFALNSIDALNNAKITNRDGSKRPLLDSTISNESKLTLIAAMGNLNKAHEGLTQKYKSPLMIKSNVSGLDLANEDTIFDYITVAAGDIFRYLEDKTKYIINLIEDKARDLWHFILTIGGKVYGFALKTIDQIAAAARFIWENIVHGFKDLLQYLKFLFDWGDMVRTKDVMKQFVKIFFNHMAEDIQSSKQSMDKAICSAEQFIKNWADSPENLYVKFSDNKPINSLLDNVTNYQETQMAPAKMIQSHFAANVRQSQIIMPEPSVEENLSWSGLADLSSFEENEREAITDLVKQIRKLFLVGTEQVNTDLISILKCIAKDIAVAAMELFKMAADKVLDFITLLIEEIIKALDTPISIPVVGTMLEDLFGIKLPSMLDVICIMAAVPTTIIYKASNGKAPYPAGDGCLTEKILKAKTYKELRSLFQASGPTIELDEDAKAVIFETGHLVAGLATAVNGVLVMLDEETDDAASTVLSTPITITSIVASITECIADLFVIPAPLKNKTMITYQSVVSKINLLQKVVFWVAPKAITKIKGLKDVDAIENMKKQVSIVQNAISAILSLAGLVPPAYHIYEIIESDNYSENEATIGIMESTQIITNKTSTVIGFAALIDSEEISKQILTAIQGSLIEITAGTMVAESVLETAQ